MDFSKLNHYKGKVKPVRKVNPIGQGAATQQDDATGQPQDPTQQDDSLAHGSDVPSKSQRTTAVNGRATLRKVPERSNSQTALAESPFYEDDNEKNILFLDKAEIRALSKSETDVEDAIPQIKGATILKLVERVTYAQYADPNFQSDFLLTFRSFSTPSELLELVIKRYNMPPPSGANYGALQDFKQNKQRHIRLRVINLLKNWLEKSWIDFIDDPSLGKRLEEFINNDLTQSGNQTSAEQLSRLLQRKRDDPEQAREVQFSPQETPPKPILPNTKKSGSSATLGLMDFSSEEIARQLTLIEFGLYKSIKHWEFFNQSWTKPDKEERSPNILKMIKRFNKVSNWVATEVVSADPLKQRSAVLAKFIEIADKCRVYNNFNALMEVLSGMQSSSVYRLRGTWDSLSSKHIQLFEELKELMSRQQNFGQLRKHLKKCNPPLIPYLGVYLTDLTFIEDGNPNLLEGGLTNWIKRRRLATVLKDIQQYQQKPYCLESVPFIQDFLLKRETLDEDECYKLSLARETRSADKDQKRKSVFFRKTKDKQGAAPQKDSPTGSKKNQAKEDDPEEEEDEEFEIQYKQGYKFYDKDSEQNIIIEKDSSGEIDIINAGTLSKLVERLTYDKYPDTSFVKAFLMTYRTFVTPMELLDLLIMRFHIPPPVNPTPELMERFKNKKELPIQLRVFNACKLWVDYHFDDFMEDRAVLQKLLEFVDKSMLPSQNLGRGGENLKAQISVKITDYNIEKKKTFEFDSDPPAPILPTVPNPTLLDFSPLELARQFVLMDFDVLTSIKPLEYLHFSKPSSWSMTDELQEEESAENVRVSPHLVAVLYRFTDRRDWVATEIMKSEDKVTRAKVIDHFIQIAQNCVTVKNFQAFVSIISGLNFSFVLKLKSTWKLIPPASLRTFLELTELASYKNNYKFLREKLSQLDYPIIPYLGMYLQDFAGIKEQMPDTIEPGSFVNFAKRQKLSSLISDIYHYHQQGFCLQVVPMIDEYLKQLDIYEISEMRALSESFQETDGDKLITEDVFEQAQAAVQQQSAQQIPQQPARPNGAPQPAQGLQRVGSRGVAAQPASGAAAVRGSQSPNSQSPVTSPRASVQIVPPNNGLGSPRVSPQSSVSRGNDPLDPSRAKPIMMGLLQDDAAFRQEVKRMLDHFPDTAPRPSPVPSPAPVAAPASSVTLTDPVLLKHFPGARITPFHANDVQGSVYGWPEDIQAKIVNHGNDLYVVPTVISSVDTADLAIHLRIALLYESMNRLTLRQRPLVAIFCTQISNSTKDVASKLGVKIITV